MGKTKDHGPSIDDDARYEALRDDGMSKEKAARIANTPPDELDGPGGMERMRTGRKKSCTKAREVGVDGRSRMSKDDPIRALRN